MSANDSRRTVDHSASLAALHENAKAYSLANTALRERWGYTHSTTLAYLIEMGLLGPTDPTYTYSPAAAPLAAPGESP